MRTKIISENAEYQIVKETVDNEGVLCNDFYAGDEFDSCRCRLKLGEAVATLEKRKSVFIFWSDWTLVEMTNIADVVQEWMTEHFNGAKLWNGRDSDKQTKNN